MKKVPALAGETVASLVGSGWKAAPGSFPAPPGQILLCSAQHAAPPLPAHHRVLSAHRKRRQVFSCRWKKQERPPWRVKLIIVCNPKCSREGGGEGNWTGFFFPIVLWEDPNEEIYSSETLEPVCKVGIMVSTLEMSKRRLERDGGIA